MAELAAQTVEELDFDTPDGIAQEEEEENSKSEEEEGAVEGEPSAPEPAGGAAGQRGRGRGARGRGRGGKSREPYVPDAPAARDRLTEDELTAKMEAMRLQNAQLQAKRDAAIEDENEYSVIKEQAKKEQEEARKEQEALKARTKEIQKAIDAEREASAARKLKKLTGREWDREKTEDDWNPAYGAPRPATADDSDYTPPAAPSSSTHSQSRSGRGRGGRGRGSQRAQHSDSSRRKQQQAPPTQADITDDKQFPSLNASAKAFEPASASNTAPSTPAPPEENGAAPAAPAAAAETTPA